MLVFHVKSKDKMLNIFVIIQHVKSQVVWLFLQAPATLTFSLIICQLSLLIVTKPVVKTLLAVFCHQVEIEPDSDATLPV